MAKTLLRLTRHGASEAQLNELRRLFGEDLEIVTISEDFPGNSREAVARFDELVCEHDADIVEAVLPVNLLQAVLNFSTFCKEGGQVIRAQMNREIQESGKVTFTFDHYERMIKVEIVTEVL